MLQRVCGFSILVITDVVEIECLLDDDNDDDDNDDDVEDVFVVDEDGVIVDELSIMRYKIRVYEQMNFRQKFWLKKFGLVIISMGETSTFCHLYIYLYDKVYK